MLLALTWLTVSLTVTLFSSGVNIPRLSQPLAEIKAVSIARWRNVRAADSFAGAVLPAQSAAGVDHAALAGIDQRLGYLKIIGDHLEIVPVEDRRASAGGQSRHPDRCNCF